MMSIAKERSKTGRGLKIIRYSKKCTLLVMGDDLLDLRSCPLDLLGETEGVKTTRQ